MAMGRFIELVTFKSVYMGTIHGKVAEPFLTFQGSRAGLFYGLSMGEFCPLPLFPSATLGARGFPHR
jgi:hypothetical protein